MAVVLVLQEEVPILPNSVAVDLSSRTKFLSSHTSPESRRGGPSMWCSCRSKVSVCMHGTSGMHTAVASTWELGNCAVGVRTTVSSVYLPRA